MSHNQQPGDVLLTTVDARLLHDRPSKELLRPPRPFRFNALRRANKEPCGASVDLQALADQPATIRRPYKEQRPPRMVVDARAPVSQDDARSARVEVARDNIEAIFPQSTRPHAIAGPDLDDGATDRSDEFECVGCDGSEHLATVFMEEYLSPSLNRWQRMHWSSRTREKKRVAGYLLAYGAAQYAFSGPVTVRYERVLPRGRRGRLMDADNLAASFKPIGDALEGLGIVVNDRDIHLHPTQRIARLGEAWGTRLSFEKRVPRETC